MAPRRSYLICATPRTGSYLLCERLRQTGLAGYPTEYFSPGFQGYWAPRWDTPDDSRYLQRARRQGTSANGVFGAKAHGRQFARLIRQLSGSGSDDPLEQAALVDRWFPGMRYVWLRRRDRVRQAVSYVRAVQTEIWWDADEAPAPYDVPRPGARRFDFAHIETALEQLGEEDDYWERYFRATGIEPLVLEYEEMVQDLEGSAMSVLGHVGLEPPSTFRFGPSGFRRQSDETSERWVGWFTRLAQAKKERNLATFRDIFRGETIVVAPAGHLPDMQGDGAIGIVWHTPDGAGHPRYVLVVQPGAEIPDDSDPTPPGDVTFTLGKADIDHPFTVPVGLARAARIGSDAQNALAVPADPHHPSYGAVALAAWLGSDDIVVGEVAHHDGSDISGTEAQWAELIDTFAGQGVSVRGVMKRPRGVTPPMAGKRSPPVAEVSSTKNHRSRPEATGQAAAGPGVAPTMRASAPATARRDPGWFDLETCLGSRRWLRCTTPFPHVRATDVFVPGIYEGIVVQFRRWHQSGGFGPNIPGYDAETLAVTSRNAGAFSIFLSRPWHDVLSGLFDVDATGDINVALHHHRVGSPSGSPHNDLNPGWFCEHGGGKINVHDPELGDYQHGTFADGRTGVEQVRAVALIYYLANPVNGARLGGGTGLYRSVSDPVHLPTAVVPPTNNSLVAFECTPFSFHSFLTNPFVERNCLVMWLHRRKPDAVSKWGEGSIVRWA